MLKKQNTLYELVEKYRKEFDVPENVNHYEPLDYRTAQRTYILYKMGLEEPKRPHQY